MGKKAPLKGEAALAFCQNPGFFRAWQDLPSKDFLLFDNDYSIEGDDTIKKVIIVLLALVLVLTAAGAGLGANPATKSQAQTTCPVLGGKINQDVYADYQGQRGYFCCPGCVGMFQKDPGKYLGILKEQGATPDKALAGK